MLITCPECELQLSDKAMTCPHCGYPMIKNMIPIKNTNRLSRRRKRLPNGFGQITEIRNTRLRNRFRAMVTIGRTADGKYKRRILKPQGYFATYNDAYEALMEYNKNPYDLNTNISVKDLYERWSEIYYDSLSSDSGSRTYKAAWNYCSELYDMRAMDVRARHIKGVMENGFVIKKGEKCFASPSIKSRIKSMFNMMFDYALEYEIVDKNYARTFNLSDDIIKDIEKERKPHITFTEDEMELLWGYAHTRKYVDIVIFQCYSGFRPQEIGLIRLDQIDLDNWIIKSGMKTPSGKNRTVPVHPKVRFIVKKYYKEAVGLDSEYLFNATDATTHKNSLKMTYDKYAYRFRNICEDLGLNPEHRPHDGRMHFITMAKKYELNEYAIKYIAGHKINDITEKIYTQRKDSWLIEEMKKIK